MREDTTTGLFVVSVSRNLLQLPHFEEINIILKKQQNSLIRNHQCPESYLLLVYSIIWQATHFQTCQHLQTV